MLVIADHAGYWEWPGECNGGVQKSINSEIMWNKYHSNIDLSRHEKREILLTGRNVRELLDMNS